MLNETSQSDVEWLLLTGIPTKAITFTDTVIYLVPSVFQTTKKIKEALRSMVYRDSAQSFSLSFFKRAWAFADIWKFSSWESRSCTIGWATRLEDL